MSTCSCPRSSLTSVAFAHGVMMQRCRAHELQAWTVEGRPADDATVRRLLKDLFVESRGRRGRSTSPAPARTVVHLDLPAQEQVFSDVALDAGADAQLTALLRSRGLQGSWAVA